MAHPAEDEHFLRQAIDEARKALADGEVPVGAVLVVGGEIVGAGHNARERQQDPLAHAEMEAIRAAAEALGSWRIGGTLYVTLEPCPMCAGAIIMARIERLVYGAADPKAGAAGSVLDIFQPGLLNHTVEVSAGTLADECGALLQEFFEGLRVEGSSADL
jgi:tRNA(adenine34) deaminase